MSAIRSITQIINNERKDASNQELHHYLQQYYPEEFRSQLTNDVRVPGQVYCMHLMASCMKDTDWLLKVMEICLKEIPLLDDNSLIFLFGMLSIGKPSNFDELVREFFFNSLKMSYVKLMNVIMPYVQYDESVIRTWLTMEESEKTLETYQLLASREISLDNATELLLEAVRINSAQNLHARILAAAGAKYVAEDPSVCPLREAMRLGKVDLVEFFLTGDQHTEEQEIAIYEGLQVAYMAASYGEPLLNDRLKFLRRALEAKGESTNTVSLSKVYSMEKAISTSKPHEYLRRMLVLLQQQRSVFDEKCFSPITTPANNWLFGLFKTQLAVYRIIDEAQLREGALNAIFIYLQALWSKNIFKEPDDPQTVQTLFKLATVLPENSLSFEKLNVQSFIEVLRRGTVLGSLLLSYCVDLMTDHSALLTWMCGMGSYLINEEATELSFNPKVDLGHVVSKRLQPTFVRIMQLNSPEGPEADSSKVLRDFKTLALEKTCCLFNFQGDIGNTDKSVCCFTSEELDSTDALLDEEADIRRRRHIYES